MHFVKTKKHPVDRRKHWTILQQAIFILPKPPESLKHFPGPFPRILLNVYPIPPTWIFLSYCPFLISTILEKFSREYCTIPAATNLKEYLHTSWNKICPSSWSVHISFSRKETFSAPFLSVISVDLLLSRD